MTQQILRNRAKCKLCGDTIESTHVHDFVSCSCGAVSVDGGRDYLRRCGRLEAIEELSEYGEVPDIPLPRGKRLTPKELDGLVKMIRKEQQPSE